MRKLVIKSEVEADKMFHEKLTVLPPKKYNSIILTIEGDFNYSNILLNHSQLITLRNYINECLYEMEIK